MRNRRGALLPLFVGLCLPLLGCISRPVRLSPETYAFTPVSPSSPQGSEAQPILVLRSVRVVPAFSGQEFVYRAADHRYERDPYARFLSPPGLLIRSTASDLLQETGLFQLVATGASSLLTHSFAEISVRQLYGDFRPDRKPAAAISLRFLVVQSPRGIPFWERTIARRIPLRERSASALMEGWNTGLRQILLEAAPPLAEHVREADQAARKAAEEAPQPKPPNGSTPPAPKS
ncbi:MAG: hypothetical protein AB7T14_09360 [Candidatus Methylacidiphilaceae bacterium]